MNESIKAKWNKVLELLKPELQSSSFDTFILPLVPKKYEKKKKTLHVVSKNDFIVSIIENSYKHKIESFVSIVFKEKVKIVFDSNDEDVSQNKIDFSTTSTVNPEFDEEFILNPKFSFENFVVGSNNQFAHALAVAVSDTPGGIYNPLFIYGASGLGKTHLMNAIGLKLINSKKNLKALYVSSEIYTNEFIASIKNKTTESFQRKYRTLDILLIDDIQFLEGKPNIEESFFNTFNYLQSRGKQIVITGDRKPIDIKDLNERLIQRFNSNVIAEIKEPTYETRIAILERNAIKEGLIVDENLKKVLSIIADNIRDNVRDLEGAFRQIMSVSNFLKKPLSPEFVKETIKNRIDTETFFISVENIKSTVCDFFGISIKDIESKKRERAITYPRQIAMFLCREYTNSSFSEIGDKFGKRDHTTVIHAHDKISKELQESENTISIVKNLKEKLTL